ncbi:efflux RND transporter periplasmic adaptor subunit [Aureimonas jatrophae]|uniref:Membrane fusion protein, multidrug efflux system n=1 Tax=Aureimonas jatrophae TaxID=1166073 RepID=A0A1H0HUV0_9HYPH|nr:efflux RND transporter periplasmic adaptor subunit [Aureimonas jatrophae]MBB3950792.1 multidrug efflux system membrane fusion protein [Aureimonas jatrophae]SDO23002.1 membrane fusion protein, multidrug efflux system [Aureimonas jatrophae]
MSKIHLILNGLAAALASVAAAAFALAFLGLGILTQEVTPARSAESGAAAAPAAIPASVARVERRPVELWQRYSGRLEAVERVEIRSRVAGAVESAHFREGALVEEGAPLLRIDPAPYQAAVERAQSDLEAARARLAFAVGERERGRQLQGNRTIAASEYERRVQAAAEAEAQLASAEAALRTARLDLSYTDIRAPVSGRIGRLEVTEGNLVSAGAGSPVLARMVSVDPIYATFDADEESVERLLQASNGTSGLDRVPVRLDLSDGRSVEGRIQLVNPSVDPVNGTVAVRASFPNADGALMPGQFARLRLGQPRSEPALLVSERAVGTDQSKRYVLVVDDQDTVQYREVALGAASGDMRIVENGLAADERVVVNGLQRLRPGAKIAPQMVSMETGRSLDRQASADVPPAH